MKNKPSVFDLLFKPFQYIAGARALIFGLTVMLLLSVVGYLSGTHFDGILDIHLNCPEKNEQYIIHAFYQLSTWIILTAVFYSTARVISKSETRFIDIAGTMALSQTPLIFAALAGFIPALHICPGDMTALTVSDMANVLKDNVLSLVFSAVVMMIVTIWSVMLKYNAYSISANLKGAKAWISFGIALFICEVISKVLIYLVVPLLINNPHLS
jgi:hypothetical protein